jgi:hypothetical protein
MRRFGLVLCGASILFGCGYDDSGGPDPDAAYWPWVCSDGGLAPEEGCLPTSKDEGGDSSRAAEAGDDAPDR